MTGQLNRLAWERIQRLKPVANSLRIAFHENRRVVDFGVDTRGGLTAGLELARICLGDLGDVNLLPGDNADDSIVQVYTDQPALACMGSQYGGWPVKTDNYFAIGSGPIRLRRGKEPVLAQYDFSSSEEQLVGILESDRLPDGPVLKYVSEQCGVDERQIWLCVAPTRSLAGTIQIVARSVEATMHKLFELGVDLKAVTSGLGTAPLPPVSRDDITAIGRTNDSILYGGRVKLWVDLPDEQISEIGPQTPSNSSPDHGQPFARIFNSVGNDFYKLDPLLFSAGQVTFVSNLSGNVFRFGVLNPSIVQQSFGNN